MIFSAGALDATNFFCYIFGHATNLARRFRFDGEEAC